MGEGIRIGGGGKNYGANVWEKKEYIPEGIVADKDYTSNLIYVSDKYAQVTLYYSSEYTYDKSTGIFTLVKPQSITVDWISNNSIGTTLKGKYTFPLLSGYDVNPTSGTNLVKIGSNATWTSDIYKYTKDNPEWYGNFSDQKKVEFVPAHGGDTVCFVVDDDSTAYPNGAVHTDGYYYELLGHIDSANVMSLSDTALMTVQEDYGDQIETEVSNANS